MLNGRLFISIFFFYDLGARTISDVPMERCISTEKSIDRGGELTQAIP